MEKSAKSIELFLETSDQSCPLIYMNFDNGDSGVWIMLTVKKSIMAAGLAVALRDQFQVENVLVGMAFDYEASVREKKLIPHTDPTINGVYVPINDFQGNVADMLNK